MSIPAPTPRVHGLHGFHGLHGLLLLVLLPLVVACTPRTTTPPEPTAPPSSTPHPSAHPPPHPFSWPVPAGWRSETIPFPLDFAPELPYRGVEELRFAPGFFDEAAPGFWSYAFAWSLERGGPALTLPQLQADLRVYFVGLARAVAEGRFETHPEGVTAELRAVATPEPGVTRFSGRLRVFDAFKTRRELGLDVEGRIFACGDRTVLLLAASPSPSPSPSPSHDSPMWQGLLACMAAFRCE